MRLPKFEYIEPRTLKEATKAISEDPGGAVLLAGGTDLLVNMKHRLIQPKRVINLKTIPNLTYISDGKGGLKIGTLTTIHNLSLSPLVQEKYPALSHAAKEVGAYAHQSMGTIGGNLCQGNRCRFYNQSAFWRSVRPFCLKTGGSICHIVRKAKECHSTYCGDLAPVFIALDSRIKVIGPNGERSFSLKGLYTRNGKKPLSLKKGEILKEIFIPKPSGKTLYLKWRPRGSLEFPAVALALNIEKEINGQIRRARIIFSSVGPGPVEASEAEKMIRNGSLDNETIEKVSNQAVKEISPMQTSIHSPVFKRKMTGILLRQALEQIMKS